MRMNPEQQKLCSLITDTVLLLCRNGLVFQTDIKLQGLLAITVDSKNFFVVQIDEVVKDELTGDVSATEDHQNNSDGTSFVVKHESDSTENCIPGQKRRRLSSTVCSEQTPSSRMIFSQQKQNENGEPGEAKFSVGLSSTAARVKTEDDDLILVDSSKNPGLDPIECCYDNNIDLNHDLMSDQNDYDERLLMASFSSSQDANKARRRPNQRRMAAQQNAYDQWIGQNNSASYSANYDMAQLESTHDLESENDVTRINHSMNLQVSNCWSISSAEENAHGLTGQPSPRQHHPPPLPHLLQHPQPPSRRGRRPRRSLRSSSGYIFKPCPCRFPGCLKRFCHETHARRHEREAHHFYRIRRHPVAPPPLQSSSSPPPPGSTIMPLVTFAMPFQMRKPSLGTHVD